MRVLALCAYCFFHEGIWALLKIHFHRPSFLKKDLTLQNCLTKHHSKILLLRQAHASVAFLSLV